MEGGGGDTAWHAATALPSHCRRCYRRVCLSSGGRPAASRVSTGEQRAHRHPPAAAAAVAVSRRHTRWTRPRAQRIQPWQTSGQKKVEGGTQSPCRRRPGNSAGWAAVQEKKATHRGGGAGARPRIEPL